MMNAGAASHRVDGPRLGGGARRQLLPRAVLVWRPPSAARALR